MLSAIQNTICLLNYYERNREKDSRLSKLLISCFEDHKKWLVSSNHIFLIIPKESQSLTQLFGPRLIIDKSLMLPHYMATSPVWTFRTLQKITWGPLDYTQVLSYVITYLYFLKGYVIIFKMYINSSILINSIKKKKFCLSNKRYKIQSMPVYTKDRMVFCLDNK